jgi:hypothetical protein
VYFFYFSICCYIYIPIFFIYIHSVARGLWWGIADADQHLPPQERPMSALLAVAVTAWYHLH